MGSYDFSGDLQLSQPKDFPALKLHRDSAEKNFRVDTAPLKQFIIKNNPIPPPAAIIPEPSVKKPAAATTPTPAPPNPAPIKDILKRLDDDEKPAEEHAPVPEPATALPPDNGSTVH